MQLLAWVAEERRIPGSGSETAFESKSTSRLQVLLLLKFGAGLNQPAVWD